MGGAIVALCLDPYGAEVLTAMTGITYLPVFGTVLNVGNIMMGLAVGAGSLNLGFQLDDVNMFVNGQKELGAPTGKPIYDTAKQTTEQASGMIAFMGLFNPRLYGDAKNNFKGSGSGETGIKERANAGQNKWIDKDGNPIWPPDRGFDGKPTTQILKPGTRIDRYGYDGGTFVSPEGTPYTNRALAPGTDTKPYTVFEVVKPVEVQARKIAPWFGEKGGGIQYEFSESIATLIKEGILRKVT